MVSSTYIYIYISLLIKCVFPLWTSCFCLSLIAASQLVMMETLLHRAVKDFWKQTLLLINRSNKSEKRSCDYTHTCIYIFVRTAFPLALVWTTTSTVARMVQTWNVSLDGSREQECHFRFKKSQSKTNLFLLYLWGPVAVARQIWRHAHFFGFCLFWQRIQSTLFI